MTTKILALTDSPGRPTRHSIWRDRPFADCRPTIKGDILLAISLIVRKAREVSQMAMQQEELSGEAAERLKYQLAQHNELTANACKAVIDYAQIAIRTIIVVNGTGATTVVALINLVELSNHRALAIATAFYAVGVGFGTCATIFAYLRNYSTARLMVEGKPLSDIPDTWQRLAGLMCVISGFVCYIMGSLFAANFLL